MVAADGKMQRYEAEFDAYRLVVDHDDTHCQVFVHDPANFGMLYTAQRTNLETAQFSAVAFAAVALFGPEHSLRPKLLAGMLVWHEVKT